MWRIPKNNAITEEPGRSDLMAERVGFEPTVPLRRHSLSRRARSAALAPLREVVGGAYYNRVGRRD